MRLAGFVFRPRWWGFALAAAGCAAGVLLGTWQWSRAEERRAALAERERSRVQLRGEFLPQYTVLLEFRLHRGRPGYHVAQAMRLAGGARHALVLRGWAAAGARREDLPAIRTPALEQRVEGVALGHLPQFLEPQRLGDACRPGPAPCVWLNLSVERFAAWSGLALEPYILEQTSAAPDGLEREWERPEAGYRKNEMYALQWFSLAALSVGLFLALSFRRE
jgi:cytochrome oxidase assembly protein ShyY1